MNLHTENRPVVYESARETTRWAARRGEFGTKIHTITDALGNPLDFVLTDGQASNMGQAETLLGLTPERAEAFIGDQGYDSDALVQAIAARSMEAVIPPRSNRTEPRKVDWFVYRERHLIECFFNKIKDYRRIFSRYEKTARNYIGMLRLVSTLLWLRRYVNRTWRSGHLKVFLKRWDEVGCASRSSLFSIGKLPITNKFSEVDVNMG